ncbi:DUF2867 domain-containing protein [Streptomyces sp. NPDC021093]|uniref:DUF2867 domain-containing protein n=1 Tax=Streptomyces sp. NPDC021093 TaxID=3365112 RepID=UPI0037A7D2FA
MKLPTTAHTSRPWRIHSIAPDFRLEDVWALPTPGGPDDLAHLVDLFTDAHKDDDSKPAAHVSTPVSRLLFAVRDKLGKLLGWDRPEKGVGGRVPSLRGRLPADLRDGPRGSDLRSEPFTSVYQTHDEWVAEMGNGTVHGLMHIGWVPDGAGGYRGQMAVLVKPNGLAGAAYMALIKPFRYLGLYSAFIRGIGREWEESAHRRKVAG